MISTPVGSRWELRASAQGLSPAGTSAGTRMWKLHKPLPHPGSELVISPFEQGWR